MTAAPRRRRLAAAVAVLVALAVAAVALAAVLSSGSSSPPGAAARVIPADALAFLDVSTDTGRAPVGRLLAVSRRFPDRARLGGAVLARIAAIVGGSPSATFSALRPWLGREASLAVLDTRSTTASTLIALAVSDAGRARAYLRGAGAVSAGSDRGVALWRYPTGTELAFLGGYLVAGDDAGVRAAIDVVAGGAPALSSAASYRLAGTGEPGDAVLTGYVSAAGLRRVLEPRGGAIGGLATLLDVPAVSGVGVALSPWSGGAALRIHSVLDPTLARLAAPPVLFTPQLLSHVPAGATVVFDTASLTRIVPRALRAGTVAGIGGRIAPLLARLGQALSAEGVNVGQLLSVFSGETVLAVVPTGPLAAPAVVLLTRPKDAAGAAATLAELQVPLSQLFGAPSAGPGQAPTFNDRPVGSVTAHQLILAPGLQLDYALKDGIVILSTSLAGVGAVLQPPRAVSSEPQYASVLTGSSRVGALLFLDFSQLLSLGEGTGLTQSAQFRALTPDLEAIRSVGLISTSGEADTTAELYLHIP